jgi:hypothetical protein
VSLDYANYGADLDAAEAGPQPKDWLDEPRAVRMRVDHTEIVAAACTPSQALLFLKWRVKVGHCTEDLDPPSTPEDRRAWRAARARLPEAVA